MQKVTDPALLSQLNGGSPAPAPAGAPGVIMGRPKAPDPYKVQQDNISNQNEAERIRIARERAAFDAEKDRLDIEKRQREAAAGPAATAAEGERKASGFLKRALNAENSYLNIENNPGPRSMVGQFMADNLPNALNSLPEGVGNSPERQQADQAQREFIAAVLRYDSGAAIPPEEFVTNARIYYPQPGDSPEVIAQKAESRRVAIEGLRDSSGIMAPQSVATPEAAAEMMQGMAGAFNPQGAAPSEGPPQGPTGNFAANVNTDALGPGEKFLFDETGTPIAIQAADGTISGYSAIVDNVSEREARDRLEAYGDTGYGTGGQAGLYRGLSLGLSDELAGISGGVNSVINGGGFGEGYRRERDVERAAQDMSREEIGILPEIAGGLLLPGGAFGQARNVGQFVRQGATLGAVSGFGEGEGAAGSATNALLGAGVGAAVGGALSQAPRAVNALLDTGPGQKAAGAIGNALSRGRPPVDEAVIAAGQRQSVPIRLADAVESKRPAMAALEKTKTGAPRTAAARAEDIAATQESLQRLSPGGGTARDEGTLGAALQSAMERTNTKAKDATSALYSRVDRLAPGAKSDATETLAYIDGEIARLSGAGKRGNASSIKALQDMRDDLAETGISVESLQSLRQSIRQRVQDNNLDMRSGDALLSRVDEAATKELEGALSAANPRALGAFRNANKSHAERLAFRREVARELLGTPNNPLDAEKAATRFLSKISAKGDEKGFNRVWESLDDAERKDIAATLVENMAGGESFSFAKLATALDPDKVNYRTLRTVFGADGAEALKDLRLIASRKNQTQRGLNNSNTGSIVEAKGNSLLDTILTVFGYTQGGVVGAVAGGAARGVGEKVANSWRSRLLLNPDFTKWLRQAPNTNNPAAINRYFDRLNKVASREQAFLMDAKALQEYLGKAFAEPLARRSAAEEPNKDRDR